MVGWEASILIVLVHEVGLHLMCLPHVVLDFVLPLLFNFWSCIVRACDTCICQVHELVARICGVVILASESQVGLLPGPDCQRGDAGDEDPLADIELFAKNDQRPFDIFLHDPDGEA